MNNMKLCSNNHEEICYNSHCCPLCKAKEEISEWEKEESKREEIPKNVQ